MLLTVVAIVGLLLLALLLVLRPDQQGGIRPAWITERIECPVRRQAAIVDFLIDLTNGTAYRDVSRCSLWRSGEVAKCDKECRSTTTAPLARPVQQH